MKETFVLIAETPMLVSSFKEFNRSAGMGKVMPD
jgi:hypothetical protein